MNLYKLTQDANNGYDTFDSCIVAAETDEKAQQIHPYDGRFKNGSHWDNHNYDCWANTPDQVTVTLIGIAVEEIKAGVILTSFNAG